MAGLDTFGVAPVLDPALYPIDFASEVDSEAVVAESLDLYGGMAENSQVVVQTLDVDLGIHCLVDNYFLAVDNCWVGSLLDNPEVENLVDQQMEVHRIETTNSPLDCCRHYVQRLIL